MGHYSWSSYVYGVAEFLQLASTLEFVMTPMESVTFVGRRKKLGKVVEIALRMRSSKDISGTKSTLWNEIYRAQSPRSRKRDGDIVDPERSQGKKVTQHQE